MGGSTEGEGNQVASQTASPSQPVPDSNPMFELTVEQITESNPRVEYTAQDPSLATVRCLADMESEGYQWEEGLVFRHRLDVWGELYRQLCLPQQVRLQCLTLAHDKFSHRGRNKVFQSLRSLFHWPNMYTDIAEHCLSCEVCHKHVKANPKSYPMQEREVVSVPSERVNIDVVGPIPKARGGFQYLLTYAIRWPEAIALRKTTTPVVIELLKHIFSWNGFPTTMVSDNGSQFCSKQFEKFLQDNRIEHVKTTPYHPQGNGIVERLHGSLNTIIVKTVEKKGNWPEVVPMALYFIRSMPCVSSGFSPFLLKHGWEPITPVQLLYKGWAQQNLGDIDLEQWVIENTEILQNLREKTKDKS